MAWQWQKFSTCRVTAKDATDGTSSFSFDGINTDASTLGDSLTPDGVVYGMNAILDIGGQSCVVDGVVRSMKSEGVES